jgi:hypothetical protein
MRVTFWGAHGSAGLIVEHGDGKICHVTRHPAENAAADATLVDAAAGADLLIFPGAWEAGLALKQRAGVKLLALAPEAVTDVDALAEAVARKSSNVFFARQKMNFDL